MRIDTAGVDRRRLASPRRRFSVINHTLRVKAIQARPLAGEALPQARAFRTLVDETREGEAEQGRSRKTSWSFVAKQALLSAAAGTSRGARASEQAAATVMGAAHPAAIYSRPGEARPGGGLRARDLARKQRLACVCGGEIGLWRRA